MTQAANLFPNLPAVCRPAFEKRTGRPLKQRTEEQNKRRSPRRLIDGDNQADGDKAERRGARGGRRVEKKSAAY